MLSSLRPEAACTASCGPSPSIRSFGIPSGSSVSFAKIKAIMGLRSYLATVPEIAAIRTLVEGKRLLGASMTDSNAIVFGREALHLLTQVKQGLERGGEDLHSSQLLWIWMAGSLHTLTLRSSVSTMSAS